MLETSADNTVLGEFSAKDVAIDGFFAYDLSPYWRGGASLKFLFSSLAEYSSFGIAVDAGISYFNPDNEFSFGANLCAFSRYVKALRKAGSTTFVRPSLYFFISLTAAALFSSLSLAAWL